MSDQLREELVEAAETVPTTVHFRAFDGYMSGAVRTAREMAHATVDTLLPLIVAYGDRRAADARKAERERIARLLDRLGTHVIEGPERNALHSAARLARSIPPEDIPGALSASQPKEQP